MAPIPCSLSISGRSALSWRPLDRYRRPLPLNTFQAVAAIRKVEIEHQGKTHELDVPEGQSILEVALDSGLQLPHDCKLGVCMTCPAKLVAGEVDQSGSMLSEDVAGQGYALLCVSEPLSDCKIKTINEDELLDLQLKTSQY